MELRLHLLMRQAPKHHSDHGEILPRLTGGGLILVVLAHAPVPPDPRNRALNYPPPGKDAAKAGVCRRQALVGEPDSGPVRKVARSAMRHPSAPRLGRVLHNGHLPAPRLFDPRPHLPTLALVGPALPDPAECLAQSCP